MAKGVVNGMIALSRGKEPSAKTANRVIRKPD